MNTEEEEVDEGMQKHSQSVKNGKNECIKRLVSASKTSSESAKQVSPMTSYPHNTMKFKTTKTDHKAHHFVVDKSLTFATCSVCGVTMKRKTVGWDTREDVLT